MQHFAMTQTAPAAPKSVTPPSEVIHVKDHRVACDGGGGALGVVWLALLLSAVVALQLQRYRARRSGLDTASRKRLAQ